MNVAIGNFLLDKTAEGYLLKRTGLIRIEAETIACTERGVQEMLNPRALPERIETDELST